MASQKTYEQLLRRPRVGSWGWFKWGFVRLWLGTVGRLSKGVRLGYRYGFDSGEMLDYVYENKARGSLLIGRVIDRMFLNAVGWKGIRQRKVNLQAALRTAIAAAPAKGVVHVADVAAGPGRYLIELAKEFGPTRIRITVRDYDAVGVEQGRAHAQRLGLTNANFDRGDAFDPQDLARIQPRPDIVVVSGLYELFADNEMIRRSLGGIRALLAPSGQLLYTNQPTHPQLEMIARTLPNREGKPWVMRLRSQEEMDGLVRGAGFAPTGTVADQWGIFTVSHANVIPLSVKKPTPTPASQRRA